MRYLGPGALLEMEDGPMPWRRTRDERLAAMEKYIEVGKLARDEILGAGNESADGPTMTWISAVVTVLYANGEPLYAASITEKCGLDKDTVSRQLDKMVELGWLGFDRKTRQYFIPKDRAANLSPRIVRGYSSLYAKAGRVLASWTRSVS